MNINCDVCVENAGIPAQKQTSSLSCDVIASAAAVRVGRRYETCSVTYILPVTPPPSKVGQIAEKVIDHEL